MIYRIISNHDAGLVCSSPDIFVDSLKGLRVDAST